MPHYLLLSVSVSLPLSIHLAVSLPFAWVEPQCNSNLIYLLSVVLKYFDSDLSSRYKCQFLFLFHFLFFFFSFVLFHAVGCLCLCGKLTLSKHFVYKYNLPNININSNEWHSAFLVRVLYNCKCKMKKEKEWSVLTELVSIMVKCVHVQKWCWLSCELWILWSSHIKA